MRYSPFRIPTQIGAFSKVAWVLPQQDLLFARTVDKNTGTPDAITYTRNNPAVGTRSGKYTFTDGFALQQYNIGSGTPIDTVDFYNADGTYDRSRGIGELGSAGYVSTRGWTIDSDNNIYSCGDPGSASNDFWKTDYSTGVQSQITLDPILAPEWISYNTANNQLVMANGSAFAANGNYNVYVTSTAGTTLAQNRFRDGNTKGLEIGNDSYGWIAIYDGADLWLESFSLASTASFANVQLLGIDSLFMAAKGLDLYAIPGYGGLGSISDLVKFDLNGNVTAIKRLSGTAFGSIVSLTADQFGYVYVTYDEEIEIFDSNLNFLHRVFSNETMRFTTTVADFEPYGYKTT